MYIYIVVFLFVLGFPCSSCVLSSSLFFNMVSKRDIDETLANLTLDGTQWGRQPPGSATIASTVNTRIVTAMEELFRCLQNLSTNPSLQPQLSSQLSSSTAQSTCVVANSHVPPISYLQLQTHVQTPPTISVAHIH